MFVSSVTGKSIIVLCTLFFVSFSYGKNLDIKGLHLGKTYEEIKENLPCRDFSERRSEKTKVLYVYITECGRYEDKESYVISYDIGKKVFLISRRIRFSITPNREKLKKQLIQKYGEADTTNSLSISDNMCWGDCKATTIGISNGGKEESLIVSFINYEDTLTFDLHEPLLKEINDKINVQKTKEKLELMQLKASNIEL